MFRDKRYLSLTENLSDGEELRLLKLGPNIGLIKSKDQTN